MEKEISEEKINKEVILPWWMVIFYFLGIAAFIKYLISNNKKKLKELEKVNENLEDMKKDFDDVKIRLCRSEFGNGRIRVY